MATPKPILVTGSHSSGSTWVGRMLAASPEVCYVHEPFNVQRAAASGRLPFEHWFTYVSTRNEEPYYRVMKDVVRLRTSVRGVPTSAGRWPRLVRASREHARMLGHRIQRRRVLVKDPIAVFSAEWLASRFGMDVVVTVRHPAAFAGSLKVRNWTYPFSHFLEQPLLMEDHLRGFEAEIREFAREEKDIVDQAALLWKIIHTCILRYRSAHPEWIVVRHEDLSRDPLEGFRRLYERLNLPFSEKVAAVVQRHSELPAPVGAAPPLVERVHRDSGENLWRWRNRLTSTEIDRLKEHVWEVSKEFYTEQDWSPV